VGDDGVGGDGERTAIKLKFDDRARGVQRSKSDRKESGEIGRAGGKREDKRKDR
jgi:hypothetical protein